MLVKGLAATLGARGIKVVALSPGWVRTDMGGEGRRACPEVRCAGCARCSPASANDSGKFFSYDGSQIPW